MNMRYFLSTLGLKQSRLYMLNGVLFCLLWLLVRMLFAIPYGSYLLVTQWPSLAPVLPAWRLGLLAGFFGVGCVLNSFWAYRLFAGALKILRGGAEDAKDD